MARRSAVGARSEDAVQRALAPLQAEGWRLRHSLRWQGQGDIDSVAIAPTGIAVVIETKTRTYDARHLARVREQAAWMSTRRRRWACNGALGVVCLVRARSVERVEQDVLVVSIDRLTDVLRVAERMCSDWGHESGVPVQHETLPVDPAITVCAKGASARSALLLGNAIASCDSARLDWRDPLVAVAIVRIGGAQTSTKALTGDVLAFRAERGASYFPRINGWVRRRS